MGSFRSPGDALAPPSKLHSLQWITEIAANVVIVFALVVGGLVWLHRVATGSSQTAACGSSAHLAPLPGTPVTLPGVDWRAQPSTLVVAISSACPHCVNESSFYSDITHSAHRTPILIVMPQQTQTAQSFLDEHSITPSRTISADLRSIQVNVTPTLMLVSPSGVVKQAWVGELDDKQRREILNALDHL